MKTRNIGIDFARAFALMGMIIVNFKIFFGEKGNELLVYLASILEGRASAIFVFLAGVGIALMSKQALIENNSKKLKQIKQTLFKRAIFLFVFGLLFIPVWDADILHFYGIYMIITLYFIDKEPKYISLATFSFMVFYSLLFLLLDYELEWNFHTLEYTGFWSIKGFIKNLFFNGFHPVLAWVVFILMGLWFGKQDINNKRFLKNTLYLNIFLFLTIQIFSKFTIAIIANGDTTIIKELNYLLGTQAIPPLPIYLLNGTSISLIVVSSSILFCKQYNQNKLVLALNKIGQMAFTFYMLHVLLGIVPFLFIDENIMGSFSIEFSLLYSLGFILFCIFFANIWLKYYEKGFMEWLMRKIAG